MFPAKSNKLTQEYIDLLNREGGQLVYDNERWIGKIGIKLFLHKVISQILVKENIFLSRLTLMRAE